MQPSLFPEPPVATGAAAEEAQLADGAQAAPPAVSTPNVEVRRSRRRRRTVSAHREGDTTVIVLPAHIPRAQEQQWVDDMLAQLARSEARRRPTDAQLERRAQRLAGQYLPKPVRPASVRWVSNQRQRWGSCTPADATIRLSDRLQGMPGYVIDYVLLHELAHLIEAGHGPRFHALMAAYPHAERARGFLEGWSTAQEGSWPDPVDSGSSSEVD